MKIIKYAGFYIAVGVAVYAIKMIHNVNPDLAWVVGAGVLWALGAGVYFSLSEKIKDLRSDLEYERMRIDDRVIIDKPGVSELGRQHLAQYGAGAPAWPYTGDGRYSVLGRWRP